MLRIDKNIERENELQGLEKYSVYGNIKNVPSAHCSSIIQLSNGDLYVVFFAGQFEKSPDVKIYGSRLKLEYQKPNVESIWSEPKVIAFTPDHSSGNPVIYETPSGRLALLWQSMHHGKVIGAGWSVCTIKIQFSDDQGQNWSDWKFLRKNWFMIIRNRPIITENGEFLLPIHRELGKYNCQFFHNKDLELKSKWKIKGCISAKNTGLLEPCVVKLHGNKILCLIRSAGVKRIHLSRSNDNGYNWSKPIALDLPNPNSQMDAIMLKSGNIIIAFNNQESGRNNLSVALSEDQGDSWKKITILHQDKEISAHYPSMVQTKDGIIHMSYTDNRDRIGYFRFNEKNFN